MTTTPDTTERQPDPMTDTLEPAPGADRRAAARLSRFLRVLERQRTRPEAMAGFFEGIGAAGVVAALATVMAEPARADVPEWNSLPEWLRDGLHTAATWPEFDAEGFGADLAGLLRVDDDERRETVSLITSFLLTTGAYDGALLAGWNRAYDALHLPAEVPLTWGSFLTGTDGSRPWGDLVDAAMRSARAAADREG